MKGLTEEERASYERDGFFIAENLLPKGEVEGLLERFREYTHGDRSLTATPRCGTGTGSSTGHRFRRRE